VRHKLIEGDLGPLLPTRRFVFLKIRFIPVQRSEDVAGAGSHALHRNDGGDRNVVKDSRTIAGEQHIARITHDMGIAEELAQEAALGNASMSVR
jgi:hypothetical protein